MRLFVDKIAADRLRVPSQPGTLAWRQQLKEAEAATSDTLKKYIGILESCVHHFSTVRRQHQTREQQENDVPKTSLLIQLDFMENMTWPLGPEEAQDWFWATARESMTTLGFYCCVWRSERLCKENYHYISQILNHDSAYACQCLPLSCNNLEPLFPLPFCSIDDLSCWILSCRRQGMT